MALGYMVLGVPVTSYEAGDVLNHALLLGTGSPYAYSLICLLMISGILNLE